MRLRSLFTVLFAILAELQSAVPLESRFGQINGLAGALGMRFSGRVWAVDVAAEGPYIVREPTGPVASEVASREADPPEPLTHDERPAADA